MLIHVRTIITTLPAVSPEPRKLQGRTQKAFPAPSLHYGCTQEHHRLAQHAERRTRVNRTGPETWRHPYIESPDMLTAVVVKTS